MICNSSKTQVVIKSDLTEGSLIVKASPDGFSIALEKSETDVPVPNVFCINKNSEEFETFERFLTGCDKVLDNIILHDEKNEIEHATSLLYRKIKNGIILQFAAEPNYATEINHIPTPNNMKLTQKYRELFRNLQFLQHKNFQSLKQNDINLGRDLWKE